LNYKGLVALENKFAGQGFKILAFPCNEFDKQEPKSNADIQKYAMSTYGFKSPMFAKSNVNAACTGTAADCGADSTECCPQNSKVFKYLEGVLKGAVPWNFEKYLVGKDGVPVKKSGAATSPEFMEDAITKMLAGTYEY